MSPPPYRSQPQPSLSSPLTNLGCFTGMPKGLKLQRNLRQHGLQRGSLPRPESYVLGLDYSDVCFGAADKQSVFFPNLHGRIYPFAIIPSPTVIVSPAIASVRRPLIVRNGREECPIRVASSLSDKNLARSHSGAITVRSPVGNTLRRRDRWRANIPMPPIHLASGTMHRL